MATSSRQTGYDCEFVTAPPKYLECPICLLTVRQPHVITCCGNQFCQACIGRIQQDNKPCPLCNEVKFMTFLHKGVMREVNSLMVFCPNKKVGCNWEGELSCLEEHVNPKENEQESGCGYVLIECHFKCGEMVPRKSILKHESELCPKRPMGVQVAILTQKLESLIVETGKLKEEVESLKSENCVLKKESKNLKAKHQEFENVLDTVQTCVMPVPPFYFVMCNVAHCMSSKTFNEIWSPPFYSHDGGYKMKIIMHPNGVESGKGSHLSLYIAILSGEYDCELSWPFLGKVTLGAYNRKNKDWYDVMVFDSKNIPRDCPKRPMLDGYTNVRWGSPRFLSHKDLKSSYIEDDRLRFRVSRVELYSF